MVKISHSDPVPVHLDLAFCISIICFLANLMRSSLGKVSSWKMWSRVSTLLEPTCAAYHLKKQNCLLKNRFSHEPNTTTLKYNFNSVIISYASTKIIKMQKLVLWKEKQHVCPHKTLLLGFWFNFKILGFELTLLKIPGSHKNISFYWTVKGVSGHVKKLQYNHSNNNTNHIGVNALVKEWSFTAFENFPLWAHCFHL